MFADVRRKEKEYKNCTVPQETDISTYHTIRVQLANLSEGLHRFIVKPQYIVPFLQAGRMVKVKNKSDDFGWGIIVDYKKETKSGPEAKEEDASAAYIINVLMYVSKTSADKKVVAALKPCGPKEEGEMRVVPCYLNLIDEISSVRLYFNDDLRPPDNRMEVYKRIQVNSFSLVSWKTS